MMSQTASVDPAVIAFWPALRARLYKLCGLVLDDGQAYLLRSRLEPVARQTGHPSLAAFLSIALAGATSPHDAVLVEALTTHETSFFRDMPFWTVFREQTMPAVLAAGSATRSLRAWSAACSTGQEPYTLAMCLEESFPNVRMEIFASDVAEPTLERARSGVFSAVDAARGLTMEQLARWFRPSDGGQRVTESIRRSVTFEQYNLLGPQPPPGRFDVILCRNVLVYFDEESRDRVLARLITALAPGGWLGLGATEVPLRDLAGVTRVLRGSGWLRRT